MSVDPKVHDLALAIVGKEWEQYTCSDGRKAADSLADAIQDRIEDWFESEELEMP